MSINWQKLLVQLLTLLLAAAGGAVTTGGLEICVPKWTAPPKPDAPKQLPTQPQSPMKPTHPKDHPAYDLALSQIYVGQSRCSISTIGPRASDGYYYGITSAHCFLGAGKTAQVVGHDGHKINAELVGLDTDSDLALVRWIAGNDAPYVLIASGAPKVGSVVWHRGYGVDRPNNLEVGVLKDIGRKDKYCTHTVSLSAGDSGSGLFLGGTARLVGVNHSASRYYSYASSWHETVDFLRRFHPDGSLANPPYMGYNDGSGSHYPPSTGDCYGY